MNTWTNRNSDDNGGSADVADELAGYAGQPVLVPGEYGENVVELCKLLQAAGHETDVAAGKTSPVLDDAVYAAVEAFRRQASVSDEMTRGGELKIVGPHTWAALTKAAA